MADFSLQLGKFAEKVKGRQDDFVRLLVLKIYRRLVMRTPVRTGRAQNSWQINEDTPDLSTTEAAQENEEAIIAEAMAKLKKFSAGGVVWITNNLPYIIPLEEGHSDQAPPGGIVEITIEEFEDIVRQAGGQAKTKNL